MILYRTYLYPGSSCRPGPPGRMASFVDEVRCLADGRTTQRLCGGQLVACFNQFGLAVIEPEHGGDQPKRSTAVEQPQIPHEVRREPDREADRTATWSLTTLQRVTAGTRWTPTVSTFTIWCVLHDSGFDWGKDRTWCESGTAQHKRKSGTVTGHDPDATVKTT